MNRSEHLASAMPYEQIDYYVKMQGAGTNPLVVAPTTFSATSSKGFMPRSINLASITASDHTRTGVGQYTVKLSDATPLVLNIEPQVMGPNATWATIADFNPTTRVISVLTFNAAGAAADLAATDFLTMTIKGTKSVPGY